MKKVMVFGVFDILHPGHLEFFKQAHKHGNFLIVSVARDKVVKKIKKTSPIFSEIERKKTLEALSLVNKVVLGSLGNPVPHIKKQKPDVIALGYDQSEYVDILDELDIKVVRLKSYKPQKYKSSKIRSEINKWVKHIK